MLPVALANMSWGVVPMAIPARKAPNTMLTFKSAAVATNTKQRKSAKREWDRSSKILALDELIQRRTQGSKTNPESKNIPITVIVKATAEVVGAETPAIPVAIANPA